MQDRSEDPIRKPPKKDQFVSTRHRDAEPDTFDPKQPRLGRRESEPHSAEITYLYSVLTANFPDDRTIWDLHHYFKKNHMEIDIQFDVSYFKDLNIPYTLSSYRASEFNNRIPDMAVNILSQSTWRSDLAEKVDLCRFLEIPVYIVFPSYHVANEIYKPPFLRAYILQDDGRYEIKELRKAINESESQEKLDFNATIDVNEILPFRIGLRKRTQKHQGEEPLYRLVLVEPDDDIILLTKSEKIVEEKDKEIEEKDKKLKEKDKKLKEKDKKLKELEAEI
ncbi:MAG: Uma2 family endonuclease, partial [Promethearchaeota archaeon]